MPKRQKYADKVLMNWWRRYYDEIFYDMLPYSKYRDSKRHRNIRVNDICQLYYNNTFKPEYRLCRVVKTHPDMHGDVRTVDVQTYKRDVRDKKKPYRYKEPDIQTVGVQRLCLVLPVEEQSHVAASKDSVIEASAAVSGQS